MNLTLIAAMGENRVIGKDNDLIWHMPNDLKHFKQLTSGHHIIMGRKTYESVGKPLPKRTNIIVTRDNNYKAEGCIVVNRIEDAIEIASGDEQPFITGGAEIYKLALPFAHTIELTLIHGTFEGDTFFPEFDEKNWKLESKEAHSADERNPFAYTFLRYVKH
jgi:dihydrofolate reductase